MLIPSAHSSNASDPHGPISLFCTVTFVHAREPSATWRHDQPRGSKERTSSMTCPDEFEPPISMFAPPSVAGAPARVPLIWMGVKRGSVSRTSGEEDKKARKKRIFSPVDWAIPVVKDTDLYIP